MGTGMAGEEAEGAAAVGVGEEAAGTIGACKTGIIELALRILLIFNSDRNQNMAS